MCMLFEDRRHCGLFNGGCSDLCLPNLISFSCACSSGYKLLEDGRSCSKGMSIEW